MRRRAWGAALKAPAAAGGLSSSQRADAQAVLDALQGSNIALQITTVTTWVQNLPSTCRVRVAAEEPRSYDVYLFWTPWLAAQPYVWLTMRIPAGEPAKGDYSLGTADPVLPGGKLNADGRTINPASVDTTLLSRYGAEQAAKGKALMLEHAGDALKEPGAGCQVLKNGGLRLLPASA